MRIMKFVILNKSTGSYWAETGWDDLYSAKKYTLDHSHDIELPSEGVWITLRAANNLSNGVLEI